MGIKNNRGHVNSHVTITRTVNTQQWNKQNKDGNSERVINSVGERGALFN